MKDASFDRPLEQVDLVLDVEPARPPLFGRESGIVHAGVEKGVVGHEPDRRAIDDLALVPGIHPLHRLLSARHAFEFQAPLISVEFRFAHKVHPTYKEAYGVFWIVSTIA